MLRITVPGGEYFDESTSQFLYGKDVDLQMEHSLISISKWEAKWHKAYLTNKEKTPEEQLDYFRCMTINKVDPEVYDRLTARNIEEIMQYINEPMTAYHPNRFKGGEGGIKKGDTMISELIYYYMIMLGIPFECEKWHFNKLMALIEVCLVKNGSGSKTMSKRDLNRRNSALNASRRKAHHTKG